MFKRFKKFFKPDTIITIDTRGINELVALYDPLKYVIGVRKGSLDKVNQERFMKGLPFEFNGSTNDFIVLPKTSIKEANV